MVRRSKRQAAGAKERKHTSKGKEESSTTNLEPKTVHRSDNAQGEASTDLSVHCLKVLLLV